MILTSKKRITRRKTGPLLGGST